MWPLQEKEVEKLYRKESWYKETTELIKTLLNINLINTRKTSFKIIKEKFKIAIWEYMLASFRPVILGLKKFLLFRIKSLYRSFTQYWHKQIE